MTTFKVVVANADVIDNGTNVTVKKPNVIVNVIEKEGDVIDNVTVNVDGDVSRKEQILSLMRHDKRISVKQIAAKLGVTSRTIFREIDILKSEGKIGREGSDKAGTWIVTE